MAETSWSAAEAEAPKKRRIPGWVWFCGAGCLLAVIVSAVAAVFVVRGVRRATDPEVQWAAIDEVLPYDQRPQGWTPRFGVGMGMLGFETYVLEQTGEASADGRHPAGLVAVLMVFSAAQGEEIRRQMLDAEKVEAPFNLGGRTEMRRGAVDVQGRTLKVLRAVQTGGQHGGGETAIVDLTPEGSSKPVLLQLIRPNSQDPIRDEEIVSFLEPFDVDRDG